MTSTFLTSGWAWYDKLISLIPEGKLFSWHAVFDAIPDIIRRLPITLGLTIAGAALGLFGLGFCHCQNQQGSHPLSDSSGFC